MIRLRLTPQSLEHIPAFVAAHWFAEEEVPLRGMAARMDAALGGEASLLLRQGRLSGAWRAKALLATRGRAAPHYFLFAGLGSLQGLTLTKFSRRVEQTVAGLLQLPARQIALGVHGTDAWPAAYAALAQETVGGVLRAAAAAACDVDVSLSEPEPARYEELAAVAQRAVFRSKGAGELSLEVVV